MISPSTNADVSFSADMVVRGKYLTGEFSSFNL
ncbi:MAG: hypothetical protein JWR19_25 [Pedosphaera sp.]|nr:hypothetical protein [Pedosphaera sp.]